MKPTCFPKTNTIKTKSGSCGFHYPTKINFVMMKRSFFTLVGAISMIVTLNGQIVLTDKTHGFRVGDSHDFLIMKNVDEGAAGSDVIWDFSGLQMTEKTLTSHMLGSDATEKTNSIPQSNLVLEEFGNHFVFKVSKDRMEQYGTVSCNTVTIFDKPFVKLKFPFEYGDVVKGLYSGVQKFDTLSIPVKGSYNINADAYGTLLLPDNIEVNNVLRVKQSRTIDSNNGTSVIELTYRWYAEQVRYPILVIIKYVLPQQTYVAQTAMYAHVANQKKSFTDIALVEPVSGFEVFPNPYEEKLTINYNLNKTCPVKIEMYDVSGKLYNTILNTKKQESGFKSLIIEGSDNCLIPGIYYVRITVDNSAYTKKVVKL
jgi:hypothetical protein